MRATDLQESLKHHEEWNLSTEGEILLKLVAVESALLAAASPFH